MKSEDEVIVFLIGIMAVLFVVIVLSTNVRGSIAGYTFNVPLIAWFGVGLAAIAMVFSWIKNGFHVP